MATNERALIEAWRTVDALEASPDATLTSATRPRQKQAVRRTLPTCSLSTHPLLSAARIAEAATTTGRNAAALPILTPCIRIVPPRTPDLCPIGETRLPGRSRALRASLVGLAVGR